MPPTLTQKNRNPTWHPLILLPLGLSFLLLAIHPLLKHWRVNHQSLDFVANVQRSHQREEAFPHPPGDLPHSYVWQAVKAMEAEEYDQVLIIMEPYAAAGNFYALQFVGQAYQAQGEYLAAIDIWKHLKDWQTLYSIGLAARRDGKVDIALQAYTASWQIHPKFSTSHLASLLVEQGDLAGAEQVYQRAIRVLPRDPRQPDWHQGLAQVYMQEERWNEAAQTWQAVIDTAYLSGNAKDQFDQVYYHMAWAYHMDGQHAKAVDAIEQALALNPNLDVYIRAGQIYTAAGDTQRALNAYQQALAIDPDNETALEAIQHLQNDH